MQPHRGSAGSQRYGLPVQRAAHRGAIQTPVKLAVIAHGRVGNDQAALIPVALQDRGDCLRLGRIGKIPGGHSIKGKIQL